MTPHTDCCRVGAVPNEAPSSCYTLTFWERVSSTSRLRNAQPPALTCTKITMLTMIVLRLGLRDFKVFGFCFQGSRVYRDMRAM